MDFTLDYTFSGGPARVYTALTVRGNQGALFRHVAIGAEKPIGVWRGTVSGVTLDQLREGMPSVPPVGAPLRLVHPPTVVARGRPFIEVLETAQRESSASELRTVAIKFSNATIERKVGGTEEVLIPNGAGALVMQSAPGNTFLVSVPMTRKDGFQYQAFCRRRGVTKEAGSGMAPK